VGKKTLQTLLPGSSKVAEGARRGSDQRELLKNNKTNEWVSKVQI